MSEMSMRTAPATYTPIDRVEERSQWLPELVSIALVFAGFTLHSGQTGVVAGLLVVALWTRLRPEFVFAGGILVFVALGGGLDTFESVLVMIGFAGFLAVDIARTWRSMRPVVVFLSLFVALGATVVYASSELAVHWVGIGTAISMVLGSYALHRYEIGRFSTVGESHGADESDLQTQTKTNTSKSN